MATTNKPTPKQAAYRFFYANAGFSYDPKTQTKSQGKARCARMLAKAERDATALGYSFTWLIDQFASEDSLGEHAHWCDDAKKGVEHSHEIYGCVCYDSDGQAVQSLWGIIDPSREYRRVVEAELASEVL